jgi:AcrR family transcriptional regulator
VGCGVWSRDFIILIMETLKPSAARRLGRPLSFDRDKALHAALLQFWKTGYETTSVAELTHAMGITAPSLYTAFGDKESLFLECLERYANPGPKTTPELIAEARSARQAAQQLLELSARWFTQKGTPAGCLVASAASTGSVNSHRVRAALKNIRDANRRALQKRAERDIREGHLPRTANAQALASMTMAIVQGMSTLARDGVRQKALLDLARTAMSAWPTDSSS